MIDLSIGQEPTGVPQGAPSKRRLILAGQPKEKL
jgi:hypothetical protein